MSSALIHRVRLQHVRCLLATAQHGNMRAAAEAMAITQPAVSKIIKELEDIVGQALVQRERHGVSLTAAGEAFARHARQGVLSLEQALGSVTPQAGLLLRIGVLPSLPVSWLGQLLQAWRARDPAGTLRVISGRNDALLHQLQHGELDIVMGRLAEPDRMMDLRFEPLWAEPLVVALHPTHPLAHAPWHAWQDLQWPVVLPLPGTAIRQVADSFLANCGATLHQGSVETLMPQLARDLAMQHQALWFTPESTVRDDARAQRLHVRALPGTASEALGLYWHSDVANTLLSERLQALTTLVHTLALSWREEARSQAS